MEGLTPVVLSLGSNIENRVFHLEKACEQLTQNVGRCIKISRIYETPPFGFEAETNFLNLCLTLETALNADQLLESLQTIESEMGRVRSNSEYISRTIDIDIIFFGNQIVKSDTLTIPHPFFRLRKFVLVPLTDIDKHMIDPVTHLTIEQIFENCIDKSPISVYEKLNPPPQLFRKLHF